MFFFSLRCNTCGLDASHELYVVSYIKQEKHLASFKFALGQFCSYEHVHDEQTVIEGPMPHV